MCAAEESQARSSPCSLWRHSMDVHVQGGNDCQCGHLHLPVLHWSLSTSSTRLPCGQAHPSYDANYQPRADGNCTGDRRFHPHQPWLQGIVRPVHCGSSTLIVLSFKVRRGCDVCVSAGDPDFWCADLQALRTAPLPPLYRASPDTSALTQSGY